MEHSRNHATTFFSPFKNRVESGQIQDPAFTQIGFFEQSRMIFCTTQ